MAARALQVVALVSRYDGDGISDRVVLNADFTEMALPLEIFADGFESEDVCAWSGSAGGSC